MTSLPSRRATFPDPATPEQAMRDYSADLRSIYAWVYNRIWDAVVVGVLGVPQSSIRLDDAASDMERAFENIALQFDQNYSDTAARYILRRRGEQVSAEGVRDFKRRFKRAASINLSGIAPHGEQILRDYVNYNVSLIKTIPATEFAKIRALVYGGFQDGVTSQEIAREIKRRFKTTDIVAERIARDQLGKLDAQLRRDRTVAVLGPEAQYIWRDKRDGRVRALHRNISGRVFTYADGHPTEKHPGWPIQCRCVDEPVMELDEDGVPLDLFGEAQAARDFFPEDIGFSTSSGGPVPRSHRGPAPPAPVGARAPRPRGGSVAAPKPHEVVSDVVAPPAPLVSGELSHEAIASAMRSAGLRGSLDALEVDLAHAIASRMAARVTTVPSLSSGASIRVSHPPDPRWVSWVENGVMHWSSGITTMTDLRWSWSLARAALEKRGVVPYAAARAKNPAAFIGMVVDHELAHVAFHRARRGGARAVRAWEAVAGTSGSLSLADRARISMYSLTDVQRSDRFGEETFAEAFALLANGRGGMPVDVANAVHAVIRWNPKAPR